MYCYVMLCYVLLCLFDLLCYGVLFLPMFVSVERLNILFLWLGAGLSSQRYVIQITAMTI